MICRRVKNGLVVDQGRKNDEKEWRERFKKKALVVGERLKRDAGWWMGLYIRQGMDAWIRADHVT